MHNIVYSLALATTLVTLIGTFAETVKDEMFVQIPYADYVVLTNQIHAMWIQANSTEQGRVAMHGSRVSSVVSAENKTVTLEYADGYKFVEQMKPQELRSLAPSTNSTTRAMAKRVRPRGMSDAQWEFVKKADAISSSKPRRVNAVFGPGGKVKSVTEAK